MKLQATIPYNAHHERSVIEEAVVVTVQITGPVGHGIAAEIYDQIHAATYACADLIARSISIRSATGAESPEERSHEQGS